MGGDVQGQSFIRDEIKLEEEEGFVKFECAAFVETPVETILKSDVDVRNEEQSLMGRDVFPGVDADLKLSMKQEDGADEFITGDLDQSDDDDEKEDDVNSPPPKRSRLAVNQKKKGDSSFERKISFNCENCPFSTKNSTHFEHHLALHKMGSNSIVCSECGWYVKPSTMVTHQITRHAASMRPTVNGTEMMTMDNSNLNFVSYYCAISSKRIHKC
ncbi:RE1-silencing transcription factor [Orchesella cincta]|uniref:RE1-silencing transcription factor n=1 Tax=Orchesella cincta TaxID=48709 RepID=A0A1D2M6A9_ORCCI|nr:RE1-silencing transcription factor [Orchesella cincta]